MIGPAYVSGGAYRDFHAFIKKITQLTVVILIDGEPVSVEKFHRHA
jgi:hypothetical protein